MEGQREAEEGTLRSQGGVCTIAGASWWKGSSVCRGSFRSVQLLKRNLCLSSSPSQAVTLAEGVSAKGSGELPYGDTAGCEKQLPQLCLIRDHVQDAAFQAI